MTINQETIQGKWLEIKGEIQKSWGQLTADELEQTKGDVTAIAGLVMQKYGEGKDQFQKKLSEIVDSFRDKKEVAVANVKQALKS